MSFDLPDAECTVVVLAASSIPDAQPRCPDVVQSLIHRYNSTWSERRREFQTNFAEGMGENNARCLSTADSMDLKSPGNIGKQVADGLGARGVGNERPDVAVSPTVTNQPLLSVLERSVDRQHEPQLLRGFPLFSSGTTELFLTRKATTPLPGPLQCPGSFW